MWLTSFFCHLLWQETAQRRALEQQKQEGALAAEARRREAEERERAALGEAAMKAREQRQREEDERRVAIERVGWVGWLEWAREGGPRSLSIIHHHHSD